MLWDIGSDIYIYIYWGLKHKNVLYGVQNKVEVKGIKYDPV